MIARKQYRSAFVVEKSKLTRLLDVIKEKLSQEGLTYTGEFEAHLSGAKTVSGRLADILALDNSTRSRIERLVIDCKAERASQTGQTPEEDPVHFVRVDFDGHRPVDVTITVASEDSRLASEAMSVAEEQVERILKHGPMYTLLAHREASAAIMLTAFMFGLVTGTMALIVRPDLQISRTMWLTEGDLGEIEAQLQDSKASESDRASYVLNRQLANLIVAKNRTTLSALRDWRLFVILLPIAIIGAALWYLTYCYPTAVFLWGDAEDWHARLERRRNFVWTVVVAMLVLGIIANLAVFALGSLIEGHSG